MICSPGVVICNSASSAPRQSDNRIGTALGVARDLAELLSRSWQGTVLRLRSRKRWGSVRHLQNLCRRVPVCDLTRFVQPLAGDASKEQPAPFAKRHHLRPRKLTPEQEAVIRALAATRSLRSLAAEFGVSHETVRSVLRVRPVA